MPAGASGSRTPSISKRLRREEAIKDKQVSKTSSHLAAGSADHPLNSTRASRPRVLRQVRRRDRAYGKVMQAKARTDARAFKVRSLSVWSQQSANMRRYVGCRILIGVQ